MNHRVPEKKKSSSQEDNHAWLKGSYLSSITSLLSYIIRLNCRVQMFLCGEALETDFKEAGLKLHTNYMVL